MPKLHSRLLTILLIAVVLIGVISASGFSYREPVTFSFAVPMEYLGPGFGGTAYTTSLAYTITMTAWQTQTQTSNVGIDVWQEWLIYDTAGRLVKTLSGDMKSFGFALGGYLSAGGLPLSEAGFIRINEHHFLRDAVPSLSWGGYVFTTHTEGNVLVDGQVYAGVTLMPWPTPTPWMDAMNSFFAPYLSDEDAAFFSGDISGTSRDGTFYLIFNHALKPLDCLQYPSACVDLSALVDKGKDVMVSAAFQETWTQWSISFDPVKNLLGPCDHRRPLITPLGSAIYCIHNEEQLGPTPITMAPVKLSALMTTTATTFGTNTLWFTTRYTTKTTVSGTHTITTTQTETNWGVAYSNTTTTGTVTTSPPNMPNIDDLLDPILDPIKEALGSQFAWLWESTWGIPNWLILLAVILIVLWLISKLFRHSINVRTQ